MKATVDEDICAGFGVCVQICPEVFVLGSLGYAEVLVDEVPPEQEDAARRAQAECPSRAITVED